MLEIVKGQFDSLFHPFGLRLAFGVVADAGVIAHHRIESPGERTVRMIDGAESRHAVQLGQPFLFRSFGRPEGGGQQLILERQQQLHAYVLTGFVTEFFVHTFHLLVKQQGILRQLAAYRCSDGIIGYLPTVALTGLDVEHVIVQL